MRRLLDIRRARWRLAGAAILVAAGIVAGLTGRALVSSGDAPPAASAAGPAPPRPVSARLVPTSAATSDRHHIPGTSVVATARHSRVAVYRHRGAPQPVRTIKRRVGGGRPLPLVFLVKKRRSHWLRVALPTRPNLSAGWIRRESVRLAVDPFALRVELDRHRIVALRRGHPIAHGPIAVGRAVSPTPTGRYYITDLLRPPDPHGFYGPYAFGLSAHSPVYTSFEGGDGQVGIHGTSDPGVLGTDVSHGCIRIGNELVARLAKLLPLGTPVTIQR